MRAPDSPLEMSNTSIKRTCRHRTTTKPFAWSTKRPSKSRGSHDSDSGRPALFSNFLFSPGNPADMPCNGSSDRANWTNNCKTAARNRASLDTRHLGHTYIIGAATMVCRERAHFIIIKLWHSYSGPETGYHGVIINTNELLTGELPHFV